MARASSKQTEPFPSINTGTQPYTETSGQDGHSVKTRKKRGSSNLGGDPRGDTNVGSLTTYANQPPVQSPGAKSSEKGSKSSTKRRQSRGLFNRWKRMSIRHTWSNPLILLLLVVAAYFISPGPQNPLRPALFLSYADPPFIERTTTLPPEIGNPTQYGKGRKDFAFVAYYTIFFTFTREFLMQRVIRPIALHYGIKSAAKQARFMEQFYTAIYFAIFGPFGLFVMSRTPVWFFNTAGMYADFPHRAHDAYFKAYYLLQASYWAQQAIVLMLQLEKPRKDFKELVLHHVVTLSLIFLSYRFHFAYMGVAVYITHDISDFFLASVKVLNYIDSPIVPVYYTLFIGIWAYLRHFINLRILWSMLPGGEFQTIGRYDLSWPEQQYKCLLSQSITSALLTILQAVNIFWFVLILRIFFRFALGSPVQDERSDDEDAGKEEQANGYSAKPTVTLNGELLESPTSATSGFGSDEHKHTAKQRR